VIRAQEVRVANDSSAPARQDTVSVPKDTVKLTPDSLQIKTDTLMAKDTVRKKKNSLDAVVTYQAKDSILMTAGNWAYLFGEGNVKYRQIELQSEVIEMNMDSSLVFAKFGLDSMVKSLVIRSLKTESSSTKAKPCGIISGPRRDT
jgi:hypothetical protein